MSFEVTFELRAKKYKMSLEPNELISDVKTRLVELLKENGVEVCSTEMRLIFGAKILDTTKSVEECKITENSKVFLTIKSNKPTAPPQPQTTQQNPQQNLSPGFAPPNTTPFNIPPQMFQNPTAFPTNPQQALSVLQNNPEMQKFAIQQLGTFIENPYLIDSLFPTEFAGKSEAEKDNLRNTFLQQFKIVYSQPELMTSMLQSLSSNQPMMGSPGGMPGTMPGAMPGAMPGMAQGMLLCPHGCYAINYILQTPQVVQPTISPVVVPKDAKNTYAEQLKALNDMGFCNEDANLKALVKANGDLSMAVEILVQTMGGL